jgi:hypothetical protein
MSRVGTIFSNLTTRSNWSVPTFSFPKKTTLIDRIRIQQWNHYQKSYKKFLGVLSTSVVNSHEGVNIVNLSAIGQKLQIDNIQDKIFVPAQTKIAQMCCVDEATQTGDFIEEENLQGDRLGTISDPNIPRYLIDVPGSGALLYECENCEKRDAESLMEAENRRMAEMSDCIVKWCKRNGIIKFTVTYHAGCGAVHKRYAESPEICHGSELDVARSLAKKTAEQIHLKSLEYNYPIEITTAFIGNTQMSKLRPPELHNALGTAACLDSRVSVFKLDSITGTNFFDVSVFNDLLEKSDTDTTAKHFLDNAIHDIELTIGIAIGNHGWNNEHFDTKNPYPVMLFAGNDSHQQDAQEIFSKLESKLPKDISEKLGFYLIRTDL